MFLRLLHQIQVRSWVQKHLKTSQDCHAFHSLAQLNGSKKKTSEVVNFSVEEERLYSRRYENGYDLHDERYLEWLDLNHPKEATQLTQPHTPNHMPQLDLSSPSLNTSMDDLQLPVNSGTPVQTLPKQSSLSNFLKSEVGSLRPENTTI